MIENDEVRGNLPVDGEYTLNGLVQGPVRVASTGRLTLDGIAQQAVTVDEGGSLSLRGIAQADVFPGGRTGVTGIVEGGLRGASGRDRPGEEGVLRRRGREVTDTGY